MLLAQPREHLRSWPAAVVHLNSLGDPDGRLVRTEATDMVLCITSIVERSGKDSGHVVPYVAHLPYTFLGFVIILKLISSFNSSTYRAV